MAWIGDEENERGQAKQSDATSRPLVRELSTEDDDVSIEVFIEEIEGELLLDGRSASSEELQRARNTVTLLEGLLPRLNDNLDAARVSFEMGTLLGSQLDEPIQALEALREAHQLCPTSLVFARGYRKAAMRVGANKEIVAALEAESKLSTVKNHEALLNVERAHVLEELGNVEAARFSYLQTLDATPHGGALEALERLSLVASEPRQAATFAQKLAGHVADVAVKAEHLARAARHLDRAGDAQSALALAVQAQVHAPGSPAISFTVERLLAADGSLAELASLRERQIAEGIVDPTQGWFDVGVLARYRLLDADRAARAFRAAADAAGEDAARARPALRQLSQVLEGLGRWEDLLAVEKRLLALSSGADAAHPWHRIARIYDEQLDNPTLAAQAYHHALTANPVHGPVLEAAGQLIYRLDDDRERRERLLQMHRLECRSTTSNDTRATALRRIGELLIEDEETVEEGLQSLREALALLPGNLTVLAALERGLHRQAAWKMLVDLYEHQLEAEEEPSRRAWLLAQMGLIAADRLGDHARAITAFKTLMAMGVAHPPVTLVRLAELLEGSDDHEALVEALTQIAAHTPERGQRATVLQRIAAVHERSGNFAEAITAYREAVGIAPPTHPVYADAGRAFLHAKRYDELLTVLLAGSESGQDSVRARWLVKAALVMDRHLGRTDDAVHTLHNAHELDAHSGAAETLRSILLRDTRWQDLADFLDDADETDDPEDLLERAMVAEATRDEDAVALYARALDRGAELAWLPLARLSAKHGTWGQLERRYAQLEGTPTMKHHARYRAGEIAYERFGATDRAVQLWLSAHEQERTAIAPLLALAAVAPVTDDRVEWLASLQASTRDSSTRYVCLRRRIASLDALGRHDEALEARMDVLAIHPAHPWILAEVEMELERRGDRVGLASVLRHAIADHHLDPDLALAFHASLGAVLEQLGLLREAVASYEASRSPHKPWSRTTLLGLRRCYDAIEDERVGDVLAALADCPPKGPEQSLSGRALAWWWMERGAVDKAVHALEVALEVHPCDYDALNDLAEMADATEPSRVTDAMLRAFEREDDADRSKRLGLALATRLLRAERLEPARETVDRLRDAHPGDLRVHMLHAEVHEQRGNWRLAATTLDEIAARTDAPAAVRVEALLRVVSLQRERLHDAAAAKDATRRILALDSGGDLSPDIRLDVEEALGDHQAAAASLEQLAGDADLAETERTSLLLRLATLQDQQLGDVSAALAALGRITDETAHDQITARVRTLGEKNGRWAQAGEALEATLDGAAPLTPMFEAALRRRLGDLLHQRLGRPGAAVKHYERALELEPDDKLALQTLAEISAEQSSEHAIAYHRRLLSLEPARVSSYRALRQLFLQMDELDGAFCAEAVLVGLNAADDEERYFYRQRRLSGAQKLQAKLDEQDLDLLFPDRNTPAFVLLAALQPALVSLFGPDLVSYGLVEDSSMARLIGPAANAVAHLLGVPEFELKAISAQLPATSEFGNPPMVLLPRTIEDALRREQQFVCGAVLSRIAFGGIATDSGRTSPLAINQIEHTLTAACSLAGVARWSTPPAGAVYADIKKRLDQALVGATREAVIAAAKRYGEAELVSAETIRSSYRELALRTAILCAQDPSVAVRCLLAYGRMFDDEGEHEELAALPFAISADHLRLRARLGADGSGSPP